MRKLLFLAAVLNAPVAVVTPMKLAAHQTVTPLTIISTDTIEKDVIPKTAKIGTISLSRVGTGIRQKQIVFRFDVYRATLLVSNPEKFVRDLAPHKALDSLNAMAAIVLVLDFKRSVSGKDIADSFDKALRYNGVLESAQIKDFKDKIKNYGTIAAGQRVILSAEKNKGIDLELAGKHEFIAGDDALIKAIISIWLGKTEDNCLTTLRKKLILGNNL